MSNLNFNMLGTSAGFTSKVIEHMNVGNEERVKDYLCAAFNTEDPTFPEKHPCNDIIWEATNFLRLRGWNIWIANWKDIGLQMICRSPAGKHYHSKYNHGGTD